MCIRDRFNLQKPADFHSPSMSVSDIVAIKQDGKVSYHYCDSVGFTQIPDVYKRQSPYRVETAGEAAHQAYDGEAEIGRAHV